VVPLYFTPHRAESPAGARGCCTVSRAIVRRALILSWFILSNVAVALPSGPAAKKIPVADNHQAPDKKQIEYRIDTSSLERSIRESVREALEKPDPHADERLDTDRKVAEYTRQLAIYTAHLSTYTLWLAIATVVIAAIGFWQGWQLKRTVDTSVIESQPILVPYVIDMTNLQPFSPAGVVYGSPAETFTSTILFSFENFGKTPGIIRRVQADLFLTDNDALPKVTFDQLPVVFHQEVVPGETRQTDLASRPAADLKKNFKLTSEELKQIRSEAVGNFKRFFLVGQVIYDDFYGSRITRRFCRKLRYAPQYVPPITFQAQHGGIAYNSVTRTKIPRHDPLDLDSERPSGSTERCRTEHRE